jgi:perosamine synthetase
LTLSRRKISRFVYVVRLGDRLSEEHRDWIVKELKVRGIGTGRYFAPIHFQPIYRSWTGQRSALPITELCASRSLALPFFNRVRQEQIAEVCRVLIELIQAVETRCNDRK